MKKFKLKKSTWLILGAFLLILISANYVILQTIWSFLSIIIFVHLFIMYCIVELSDEIKIDVYKFRNVLLFGLLSVFMFTHMGQGVSDNIYFNNLYPFTPKADTVFINNKEYKLLSRTIVYPHLSYSFNLYEKEGAVYKKVNNNVFEVRSASTKVEPVALFKKNVTDLSGKSNKADY